MGKIVLKGKPSIRTVNGVREEVILLDDRKFDKFSPNLLGLDDISLPSEQVEALAAIFDLSGFTNFCSQVDPHLAVPEYLSQFLDWLFDAIKRELTIRNYNKGKVLWTQLPFLAKFLGDGVLFLWDTSNLTENGVCNIVGILHEICKEYHDSFYQEVKKRVVNPPSTLRCGIARGRVFSVGNAEDYVGPCINIATRLQKLGLLTFCFSRRGLDVKKNMDKTWWNVFVEKRIQLRGIGRNELVWIVKKEFDNLPAEEKSLFRKP